MTDRAIKEFRALRDDLFGRERTDKALLPATMCASYDALATTSRYPPERSLCR